MTTVYDIQQLLKRFGIIVYTGNRIADLQLMEEELRDLHDARLLEQQEYETALFVLRKRVQEEQAKLQ